MEDMTGFVSYDSLAYAPLQDLGWTVEEVPWTRPDVKWKSFDAIVIRSTWDYQRQPEAFLSVLEIIEIHGTPLFNSLEYCRWNMNKKYLRDLERKGVRILPTIWGETMTSDSVSQWCETLSSERVVMKPIIGANADDTFVLTPNDQQQISNARQVFQLKPFLVQPFVQSIQTTGEFSLFYFGGHYSHAINKRPKQGDFRVQEEHGGIITAITADDYLKKPGQFVIDQLGQPLLYARVDFVEWQGSPALMEVELIEPSLYFAFDEESPRRFAEALDRMLRPPVLPERKIPYRI
jgi:glutathione synthase/RimK-type ligase-like ATP-grasp enzyme